MVFCGFGGKLVKTRALNRLKCGKLNFGFFLVFFECGIFYNVARSGRSMNSSISEIAQLWDRVLKTIQERLKENDIFDSFFKETYIYDIKNNVMVIVVNSKLAAQLFKKKYYEIIKDVVKEVTETEFKFEFVLEEEIKENLASRGQITKSQTYFESAVINPKLTFDNFVVGSFNREASQAALLIATNPGKMFNPLFIYSHSGLGKTHLLHAIGNYITKNGSPNTKILYIAANNFVDEYIRYVRADKDSESLKDFFKNVDVLLLDDVQFLADKVKTSEMFFYIYTKMIADGKQIVITSDHQPNELKGLEERLITRFSQGLVVSIAEPDQTTCVEILKKKIIASGLDINNFDESVLYFFAEKFSKNVRELEGALNRLIFYVVSMKQTDKITMETAIEAVQSLVGGKTIATQLNEQKIINVVAEYYNLTPSQLTGRIRTGQIAMARHIAMYLIRTTLLNVPLKKIGEMFGGKDHTTVMNGVSKVEKELKTDEKLQQAIAELKKRIGS